MTTLQPRPPYTSAELATLYPSQLQLQNVQILLRHGERTPVTARFSNAGVPSHWPYCTAAKHLQSVIYDGSKGTFGHLEWKQRLETFAKDDKEDQQGSGSSSSSSSSTHDAPVIATGPKGEVDAVCDMGMLTDKGRETTFALGQRLRKLYVEQLGFLPPGIVNADTIYLRATFMPRALESMQQAFQGLYPQDTRAPGFPPPTILTRSIADETLVPNDSNCRRFAALSRAFAQRTADRWNESDDMRHLTKKLGKWMPEGFVAVDAHPRLSGVMDTMNSTAAHGAETKLPREFYEDRVKRIIEKIGVEEWYSGFRESEEYRMLGIGALMGDVVARMVGSAEHTVADGEYEVMTTDKHDRPEAIRFGLSGCHDTTLAGVLSSLGAYDTESWPPFTSHIAFELFKLKDPTASPGTSATSAPTLPSPPPAAGTSTAESPRSNGPSSAFGWLTSFFTSSSSTSQQGPMMTTTAGAPPTIGIGRKKTPDLTDDEKQRLQGYFVRLRYNDRPVTVPGCRQAGNHLEGDETFCTLEAFKAIVDKYTPHDWKQQCRANLGAPKFPSKPEPAGY